MCVREDDGGRGQERSKAEPGDTHGDGATRDTDDPERRFPAECTAAGAQRGPRVRRRGGERARQRAKRRDREATERETNGAG